MSYSFIAFKIGTAHRSVRRGAVALAAALLVAQAAGAAAAPMLHDGVVLAPEHGVVYLMTPEGGIDGVELETGAVSWRTTEAAKPLALAGRLLIAQAEATSPGELPIATFDTARAGTPRSVLSIALPEGLRARVDQGLGRIFRVRAEVAGASAAIVDWSAASEARSGLSPEVVDPRIAPVMDGVQAADQTVKRMVGVGAVQSGTALLDLDGGTIGLTAKATAAAPAPALIELGAGEGLPGVGGRQFLSVDRRHVLASARRAGDATGARYLWTVYERSSGARVGQIASRFSAAPFFVSGESVLFASSPHSWRHEGEWTDAALSLRSIDLASGVERWSHEIRDTMYRGPFPP